ncbi:MAG: ABC transporter permease, partial [Pseudoruegeria sp.]
MTFLKSREAILLGALVVLLILIASRFPSFILPSNLVAVFTDTTPLLILALGQMAVILTRCIDLSVAANLALTGMVCAMINVAAPGLPIGIVLVVALSLGAVLGAINGLFVWKLGIPSIVVTLGTMTIFRGMVFVISEGQWINAHEMTAAFTGWPRHIILGVPVMAWIGLAAFAIMAVV